MQLQRPTLNDEFDVIAYHVKPGDSLIRIIEQLLRQNASCQAPEPC